MELYNSPQAYLFNLHVTKSSEAKRIWRRDIREKWSHRCAYCGSDADITIDHIVPLSKGGLDFTNNVVACCKSCNQSKGHTPVMKWYENQEFFTEERKNAIIDWMESNTQKPERYRYPARRNNAS